MITQHINQSLIQFSPHTTEPRHDSSDASYSSSRCVLGCRGGRRRPPASALAYSIVPCQARKLKAHRFDSPKILALPLQREYLRQLLIYPLQIARFRRRRSAWRVGAGSGCTAGSHGGCTGRAAWCTDRGGGRAGEMLAHPGKVPS